MQYDLQRKFLTAKVIKRYNFLQMQILKHYENELGFAVLEISVPSQGSHKRPRLHGDE